MHALKDRSTPLFALLALVLFVLAPTARADVDRSFEVADGGRLVVDSDLGSIEVEARGSGEARIEIEVSGSNQDELDFDITQNGDTIEVRGDYRGRSSWFGWGSRPRVKIRAMVPERFDVDLDTSGGSISVSDLEGEVRAETSGGSLSFGNIRGPVYGDTSGGSISLSGSTGDAVLDTSGGSISIGDVDGDIRAETSGGSIRIASARGSVEAETSGGSISVDEVYGDIRAETSGGSIVATLRQQPRGDCRLTTSGGRVKVRLAEGIGVDLDARASGGRVSSDFPLTDERRTKTSLAGRLGGGGPALVLRTSGGGITIERD